MLFLVEVKCPSLVNILSNAFYSIPHNPFLKEKHKNVWNWLEIKNLLQKIANFVITSENSKSILSG